MKTPPRSSKPLVELKTILSAKPSERPVKNKNVESVKHDMHNTSMVDVITFEEDPVVVAVAVAVAFVEIKAMVAAAAAAMEATQVVEATVVAMGVILVMAEVATTPVTVIETTTEVAAVVDNGNKLSPNPNYTGEKYAY